MAGGLTARKKPKRGGDQAEETREIILRHDGEVAGGPPHPHHLAWRRRLANNRVRTSKYTILTFLPVNLFEQFHRLANIYFLILVILNWIPQLNVFGKEISMLPLLFVLAATALKDLYEDYTRYRSDKEINNRFCLVWKQGAWAETQWKEVLVGDLVKVGMEQQIPADLVVLETSSPDQNCYVSTMNLDGETNLKVRKSVFRQHSAAQDGKHSPLDESFRSIVCEAPNENIYKFLGKIERKTPDGTVLDPIPLDAENLLLRGCTLRNTLWAEGVVVYAGHETKAMLNSKGAPSKRSQLEKKMNKMVLWLIVLLLAICIICGVLTSVWEVTAPGALLDLILGNRRSNPRLTGFLNFLSSIIVFQVMIPIAVYISIDIVNLFQVYFINRDLELYYPETDTPMLCRALNIHSDLGQVHYIFSDKTGTLTCNRQTFNQCSVRGSRLAAPDLGLPLETLEQRVASTAMEEDSNLHLFMLGLCMCNTALIDILHDQPAREASPSSASQQAPELGGEVLARAHGIPRYQSESPDEVALVTAAAQCGYILTARTPTTISITAKGKPMSFTILGLLPFTSERKRMSIVLRDEDNRILMLTKGADEVIFARLDPSEKDPSQKFLAQTVGDLEEFAQKGLRTLCFGYRYWEETEYEQWVVRFNEASGALEQREKLLTSMYEVGERNLFLLGATAVEDKLQDKVPETISTLYEAGIALWVLTGDMQTTAINVAYSCNLLNSTMTQYILAGETEEECLALLEQFERADAAPHVQEPPAAPRTSRALIVHGKALLHLLDTPQERRFFDFVSTCKIVICCRVSPLQKAMVVNMVRRFTDKITLAIGDGANDVGMIRAAHVGVGISGQEGRQAVMSSDFAFAQFRFLRDLLLVHGHWSYYRLAVFIIYFLYKNALFVMILFFYQVYCAFSNQTPIDDMDLILFSLAYTCLPIIAFAVFDQNIERGLLLGHPWLYIIGQEDLLFSQRLFGLTILDMLYQAAVITFLPVYAYWAEGPYLYSLGVPILTSAIIVATFHLSLETLHWTWVHHATYWLTLVLYIPINIILDATPGSPNYKMMIEGLSDPLFYLTCLVTVVAALLPRYLVKAALDLFDPSLIYQARCLERLNRGMKQVMDAPKSLPNEEVEIKNL